MDVMKLKGKMRECGFRQEDLAKALGINKSTLNRRLKTGEDFTIEETNKVVKELRLTTEEAIQIFLPSLSHKCDL